MSEYDFEILCKPGKINLNADAPSRLPTEKSEALVVQMRSMHKKGAGITVCIMGTCADKGIEDQGVGLSEKGLTDLEEKTLSLAKKEVQFLTDPKDILTVLKDFYDSVLGVYVGVRKTIARIRESFRWKGMANQISHYVLNCPKCHVHNSSMLTKIAMVLTDTPN